MKKQITSFPDHLPTYALDHLPTCPPDHLPTCPRCPWPGNDPVQIRYHDDEWGVLKLDDQAHFEHLILEIFQAGLSWSTILKRREGFRQAFVGFDPVAVSHFDDTDRERLLADSGIIRNRAKIDAAIWNAKLFLHLVLEFGSFYRFIRQFTPVEPHRFVISKDIPAVTPEAEAMSRELKRRGFKFVGPTICYAHMQSVGIVNDHLTNCFRFAEVEDIRQKLIKSA